MKKRLVMLLAGLLTVLSMGFGLAQFSDVPAGHWAKEAVEALAAKGIIVGFPDGTYRGNETLTRYQAALLIYRLLQQIEEELKAKGTSPTLEAMSSEDLEALKNAVQELAAELAALGVRVSALEDSAATKDDIARLEALIAELKAQPMPEPGMDQAALQDLADRVEAASIAADTALAQAQQLAEQLDALAQDLEGLKGDLAALATQVEANVQAIQALNELAVLLNQDLLALRDGVATREELAQVVENLSQIQVAIGELRSSLQDLADRVEASSIAADTALSQIQQLVEQLDAVAQNVEEVKGNLAALATQVEANAQAIQALNELAVLLNQDVLTLQDRATALEKGLADVKAQLEGIDFEEFATREDVAAVQEFVAALRSDLVNLSEKVTRLETRVGDLDKRVSDLARVQYSISGSLTATYGTVTLQGNNFDIDRLFATPLTTGVFGSSQQEASSVVLPDVGSRNLSSGSATLNLGVRNTAPAATGVAVSEATAALGITTFGTSFFAAGATDLRPRLNEARVTGTVDGQRFTVAYHWQDSRFKFNDYLFVNDNDPNVRETRQGVVATFSGSKLPLTPSVTVVAGASRVQDGNLSVPGDRDNGDGGNLQGNYFGVRLALKPIEPLELAVSYATKGTGYTPPASPPANLVPREASSVDGSLRVGDFSVRGLFVTSKPVVNPAADFFDPTRADWAYYVQGEGKLGPVTLRANYRAIDPDYRNGVAGMSGSHQAYYGGVDGRQSPAPYQPNQEGFGVSAELDLGFARLDANLNAYGSYVTAWTANATHEVRVGATVPLVVGFSLRPQYQIDIPGPNGLFDFSGTPSRNRVQVTLRHDGAARDALVRDLSLTLLGTYNLLNNAFSAEAFGTYKLALGPLSLDRILFRVNEPDFNTASDETLKGGVQASIDLSQLGLPFKPRVLGEVAARQTGGSGGTEELKWGVGLALGEFLFAGSSLEARYAQYSASKVDRVDVGVNDHAFAADQDRVYSDRGTASGTLSGFNITWRYYDFRVDYGEYQLERGASTDRARAFRVTYTVRF